MPHGEAEKPAGSQRGRSEPSLKSAWRRIRQPLARSAFAKHLVAGSFDRFLRLVRATNQIAPGSTDLPEIVIRHSPAIVALWHGQHLLAPYMMPAGVKAVVLVSRSADAEINALVLQKLGIEVVRGSGGRDRAQTVAKGGAPAFLALKRALEAGKNVFMIADVPHGAPRQSGPGIVKLAQLSGRPILPFAVATSRRKVIEKSWDKTTFNLPFGRVGIAAGDPVFVPADADDAALDFCRRQIDAILQATTERAYSLADQAS